VSVPKVLDNRDVESEAEKRAIRPFGAAEDRSAGKRSQSTPENAARYSTIWC
jgi:hypothetical protein